MNLFTARILTRTLLETVATQPWNAPIVADVALFILAPLLLLLGFRKIHPAFSFFLLLMFSFFYFMSNHGPTPPLDTGRHFLVIFPLLMLAAIFLAPSQVERLLSPWIEQPAAAVPCACWRFICSLPLFALMILSAWLYLHYIGIFYGGKFV